MSRGGAASGALISTCAAFQHRSRLNLPACPMTIDNVNRRRNLGFFFDQSVARAADKVAIIDLFGGKERRATYRQLDARMSAVAGMLARLGVVPGERVAMGVGQPPGF